MLLLPWLASAFGTWLATSAARFLAWKVILVSLLTVVLPVVFVNILHRVMEIGISVMSDVYNSQTWGNPLQPAVVQLTGMAAWFAQQFQLANAVSLLLTGVGIRMALRLIPFMRV